MKAEVVLNFENVSKEDLRAFMQLIREWELRTPEATNIGAFFKTDPEMSSEETMDIFRSIYPEFKTLVEIPRAKESVLRLGNRAIVVDGELIGTCTELALTIGESGQEDVEKLQGAHTIGLVRMPKG